MAVATDMIASLMQTMQTQQGATNEVLNNMQKQKAEQDQVIKGLMENVAKMVDGDEGKGRLAGKEEGRKEDWEEASWEVMVALKVENPKFHEKVKEL